MTRTIAFQGEPGAYSHQACREVYPDAVALPCQTFEGTVAALKEGRAELAMLPVENSTYGRITDIHHMLPNSGLSIIGEHFVRVHINLLGIPGAKLAGVKRAMSHTVLLGQCRGFLTEHGIERVIGADTAGSALAVSQTADPSLAALASEMAGEIYGLDILARHIEDNRNNTTRFLVMATEEQRPEPSTDVMTTFVFRVRNIPAALYKAMGGFATNGVNMVKLESYMLDGSFTATQFYADIEGHPDHPAVQRAMEELEYFTSYLHVLGVYPAHEFRKQARKGAG